MTKHPEPISGQKFGHLTYLRDAAPAVDSRGKKSKRIICECVCGNETTAYWNNVRRGLTKTCGCKIENKAVKHGLWSHPLYNTWKQMIERCYNKEAESYTAYGGRNIRVCRAWRHNPDGLIAFIKWADKNGYAPGLELDREDNDIGYAPFNCRFITHKANANNRRDNVRVSYEGKDYTFAEFWEIFGKGISYGRALRKYKSGVELMEAVGPAQRAGRKPKQ